MTITVDTNLPISRQIVNENGETLTVNFRALTVSQNIYLLDKLSSARDSNVFLNIVKVQIETLSKCLLSITKDGCDEIAPPRNKTNFCGKEIEAIDESWIDSNIPQELVVLLFSMIIEANSIDNQKKKYSLKQPSSASMLENSTATSAEKDETIH